jgi:4-amino-4-deoxy-L-arabinose transferase-like glycosyltransferase
MSSDRQSVLDPKWMFWVGWIISVLPVLMLAMSAVMKFLRPPDLSEGFTHLGWNEELAFALGIIEVACTVLFLFPPTAVLGAILLTGYLGGAIATHMRVGDPFVPAILVPIILGVLIWGGLYLRDSRLRALMPLRFSLKT